MIDSTHIYHFRLTLLSFPSRDPLSPPSPHTLPPFLSPPPLYTHTHSPSHPSSLPLFFLPPSYRSFHTHSLTLFSPYTHTRIQDRPSCWSRFLSLSLYGAPHFSNLVSTLSLRVRNILMCTYMVYVMLYYIMLCCYVMLWYVMLCYVMVCYVMLCYVILCYVILCYGM